MPLRCIKVQELHRELPCITNLQSIGISDKKKKSIGIYGVVLFSQNKENM